MDQSIALAALVGLVVGATLLVAFVTLYAIIECVSKWWRPDVEMTEVRNSIYSLHHRVECIDGLNQFFKLLLEEALQKIELLEEHNKQTG